MENTSDRENLKWAQRLAYRTREPLWWCNLAAFYATGTGCRTNLVRSRKWYAKAARAGYPRGKYELGCMFLEGEGGRKDIHRAKELLSAAAKAGDIDAVKLLEYAYSKGEYGFARSKRLANFYTGMYNKLRRSVSKTGVR